MLNKETKINRRDENDEGSLLGLDGGYEVAQNIQNKEKPSLE
jgi:hypothetical protein